MVGTEMVYFATDELGLDGGIMVTASHNPEEYTGMKIVRRGALPVGSESGLLEVRDRAVSGEWREAARGAGRRGGRLGRVRDARARVRRHRRDRARSGSWSTRRTAWRARCCRVCSSACPRSRSSAATSSRTARSRTTSRTRSCPRTASSSCARRARSAPRSGWPTTAMPTGASSSTTRASSSRATSSRRSSRNRCSRHEPGGKVIYDVRASWAVPEDDRGGRRRGRS